MADTPNGNRPISQISIPLAAVLAIGSGVLMTVLSVSAAGVWAGVAWWRAELDGLRREVHAHAEADAGRLNSLRGEMLAHNETARIAIQQLAVLERDSHAIRERISLSERQLSERDQERVRRLEMLEARSERRDMDWEKIMQRVTTIEEVVRLIQHQHARFSLME